jgi:hypothetical protein
MDSEEVSRIRSGHHSKFLPAETGLLEDDQKLAKPLHRRGENEDAEIAGKNGPFRGCSSDRFDHPTQCHRYTGMFFLVHMRQANLGCMGQEEEGELGKSPSRSDFSDYLGSVPATGN